MPVLGQAQEMVKGKIIQPSNDFQSNFIIQPGNSDFQSNFAKDPPASHFITSNQRPHHPLLHFDFTSIVVAITLSLLTLHYIVITSNHPLFPFDFTSIVVAIILIIFSIVIAIALSLHYI